MYAILYEYGGVAQLGERCVRNAEVMGSNPTISTKRKSRSKERFFILFFIHIVHN